MARLEVPLDLDLSVFSRADYDAVADYLAPLEQLVRAVPPDENGLRWRYVDGSVLFHYAKVLPISTSTASVEAVPVRNAITWMKDYIGGQTVTIHRDERGEVTHQAERNVYLPQPNWQVLYGGSVIDVAKLEAIRYGDDEHGRSCGAPCTAATIRPPYDDGSVRYARAGFGTEVTVVARQQFKLPPFWQMVDLDRFPEIKNRFVSAEYFKFFDETIDNFARAYDGEDVQIGRAWEPTYGEAGEERADVDLMTRAREFVGRFGSGQDPDGTLDENGFRHFEGPQDDGAPVPDAGRFPPEGAPDVSLSVVRPGAPGRQGPRRGGPRGVRALVTGSTHPPLSKHRPRPAGPGSIRYGTGSDGRATSVPWRDWARAGVGRRARSCLPRGGHARLRHRSSTPPGSSPTRRRTSASSRSVVLEGTRKRCRPPTARAWADSC